MNKILILLLLTGYFCTAQVNGIKEELTSNRTKVRVWGDHYERGYAYGYLLAEESIELFEEYIIGTTFYGNANGYEQARDIFLENWIVEEDYFTEFAAAIDGIEAAGVSVYSNSLGRDIDVDDIAMINSIVDISALVREAGVEMADGRGCATISSWGEATADDPFLQGDMLITRHLDWNNGGILDNHPLMLICQPSEEDEQAFITFTYPLFVTGLSAINAEGLVSFMNMGSNSTIVNYGPYQPVLLAMRRAIESVDYNGDDDCNPQDLVSALEESNIAGSAIITTVKDNQNDALIIEKNNTGQSVRTIADNGLAPLIMGDNLVATNHFRTLYSPIYCSRYAALANQISTNDHFVAERQWQVLADAAGQGTWTRMTIQIDPQNNKCLWATTEDQTPAYNTTPTKVDIRAELNGWVNKPYYKPAIVPVYLFMEDGLSDIEAELIEEFAGYRTIMGNNSCQEIYFMSDPEYMIDEYDELIEEMYVNEIPMVYINGYRPNVDIIDDYSEQVYDELLRSSPVNLEILELDRENSILYYTIECPGNTASWDNEISYTIWEDNLALSWHLEEIGLPWAGEMQLYEIVLDEPEGGWENKEVSLDLHSNGYSYTIQSASTCEDNINPLLINCIGYREKQINYYATSCIMDTLTIFNTSENSLVCELEYDLSGFLEEEIVTSRIIRANGEEIFCSAENPGSYEMLPGEYLYLITEIDNLYEYESYWEFTLAIYNDETDFEYNIPFEISRMTESGENEIFETREIYNYPNPFNPQTTFSYDISDEKSASLIIYNMKGQEIEKFEGLQGKGNITWEAKDLPSGIYLYKLSGDTASRYSKALLLK